MLPSQTVLVALEVLAGQQGLEVHWPLVHQEVPVDPVTSVESYLAVPNFRLVRKKNKNMK